MIDKYFKDMPVKIDWYRDGSLYYKGFVQRKLRKNFEVRIPKDLNKYWNHPTELASVPAEVITKITPEEMSG